MTLRGLKLCSTSCYLPDNVRTINQHTNPSMIGLQSWLLCCTSIHYFLTIMLFFLPGTCFSSLICQGSPERQFPASLVLTQHRSPLRHRPLCVAVLFLSMPLSYTPVLFPYCSPYPTNPRLFNLYTTSPKCSVWHVEGADNCSFNELVNEGFWCPFNSSMHQTSLWLWLQPDRTHGSWTGKQIMH